MTSVDSEPKARRRAGNAKGGRRGGKTRHEPGREIRTEQNKKVSVEMRMAGETFESIGRRLGVHHTRAFRLYRQAIDEHWNASGETVEQFRRQQLHRLAVLETEILRLALSDGPVDPEKLERITATNAALCKNYERAGRIAGSDAPLRIEQTDPNGISLADLVRAVRGQAPELPAVVVEQLPNGNQPPTV